MACTALGSYSSIIGTSINAANSIGCLSNYSSCEKQQEAAAAPWQKDFWGTAEKTFIQPTLDDFANHPAHALGELVPDVAMLAIPGGGLVKGARVAEEASAAATIAGVADAAGDHIVLGLRANGLEALAAQVGGRTLLKDPNWMTTLQRGVADPSTKFTVNLDGMSGGTTSSQVMSAAARGASGNGSATDWEMSQLYQGGRLADTTFMRGGSVVNNPFG